MAITVLTLAALVPVMMIPELMALSNMAGQMISTGLLAGAVSVGFWCKIVIEIAVFPNMTSLSN